MYIRIWIQICVYFLEKKLLNITLLRFLSSFTVHCCKSIANKAGFQFSTLKMTLKNGVYFYIQCNMGII